MKNQQNNQAAEQQINLDDYMPVKELCKRHPIFKPGGVRAHIFNQDKNGLKESGAIVRIGTKVLLNAPKYFCWAVSQNKDV